MTTTGANGQKAGCGPWGLGILVFGAITAVIVGSNSSPRSVPTPPAPVAAAGNAVAPAEATQPATDPAHEVAEYAPPSAERVAYAAREVQRVYTAEGLSGLSHYGEVCYDELGHGGTFGGLDFCLAFDVLSVQMANAVAPTYAQANGGWFAGAEAREIAAGTAIMQGQGDAGARVADIRRLVSDYAASQSDDAGAESLGNGSPSTSGNAAAPG